MVETKEQHDPKIKAVLGVIFQPFLESLRTIQADLKKMEEEREAVRKRIEQGARRTSGHIV